MSLFWLVYTAVEPGAGLDLPPKDDLAGRWIVGAVLILTPLIPYLVAKVQAKKPASNGPTPLTADTATPRIDAGQQYLERFVKSLEDRIKATEAKNEDLSQQVQKLLQERATFAAQVESLHADVVELRADNVELRAENRALRSRASG